MPGAPHETGECNGLPDCGDCMASYRLGLQAAKDVLEPTPAMVVHVVQSSDGIYSDDCVSIWGSAELAQQECARLNRIYMATTIEYWHKPASVLLAPRPA